MDSIEQETEQVLQLSTKRNKCSKNSNFMDTMEYKLKEYFNVTLNDLILRNTKNVEELRDLTVIFSEYEKCFKFGKIKENVKSSIQEKYSALKYRELDAVKIICDIMHFVQRRYESQNHTWKFNADEIRTTEDKIVGTIISMIKNLLDGRIYRAISETQKQCVEIASNIFGQSLTPEAEKKLMHMIARYDVLDIVRLSLSQSKTIDPQVMFLNSVEEKILSEKMNINLEISE